VADGACCKREEGMNKVHSLVDNIKSSITIHKNRSVGILLYGSEPQEDKSLHLEGHWNPKHRGDIAIKIKMSTSGQKYWNQKSSAEFQD